MGNQPARSSGSWPGGQFIWAAPERCGTVAVGWLLRLVGATASSPFLSSLVSACRLLALGLSSNFFPLLNLNPILRRTIGGQLAHQPASVCQWPPLSLLRPDRPFLDLFLGWAPIAGAQLDCVHLETGRGAQKGAKGS